MAKFSSPLRYPGGKASLTQFLSGVIGLNTLRGCEYFEPYAGGAGAALRLLDNEIVNEVRLNDADIRVYSFWRSIQLHNERFADRIMSVPLTIQEWHRQHSICSAPGKHSMFDVGFATFYMNRCNRSGVLTGAGPIGGYKQSGTWRMDVRFNRPSLAERISAINNYKKRIHVSCMDAIVFLKKYLPYGRGRRNVFVYLDPPYVNNGQRLYLNYYVADDHKVLAEYLLKQRSLPWLISYDDSELIKSLYISSRISQLPIKYSLQKKRFARELIITPKYLSMANQCQS